MKKGYKGFDKNLKCRGEQFQLETIYSKNNGKLSPKLCSSDGYHYCNTLEEVFNHYPSGRDNRYCEIEILGPYTDDSDKSITTAFKIIRELSSNEIEMAVENKKYHLDTLKRLQKKYPMFIVGGSTALYLHGIKLDRTPGDFDFVSPYFVLPETDKELGLDMDFVGEKSSGNDFDVTFSCNGKKIDYKIDPKARYEMITHNGHQYKVSPLLTILEAKIRYGMAGNSKHINDIKYMIFSSKKDNITPDKKSEIDLFF
jgi:hypothetical protein